MQRTHCNQPMQAGVALDQAKQAGKPILGWRVGSLIIFYVQSTGKLVPCLKCKVCGHSVA
jgi:hypothetical protein